MCAKEPWLLYFLEPYVPLALEPGTSGTAGRILLDRGYRGFVVDSWPIYG